MYRLLIQEGSVKDVCRFERTLLYSDKEGITQTTLTVNSSATAIIEREFYK